MKVLVISALAIVMFSCNSNSNDNSSANDTTSTDVGGVENVNGNIPDTTSRGSTPTSPTPPVDSSYADTTTKTR
jgi:hypothetical protein